MKIKEIPIDQIRPNPNQPRKFVNESKLRELADSIKSRGLLEEILVRPKDEYFQMVHGERRWRACKLLEWRIIRVKVESFSNEEAFELSLIENIQRENLLPIEEAQAYKSLADRGLTHKEVAKKVGKGRTYITQKLRILKLPFSVQLLLKEGRLSEGHMRQLLRLEDIIGRHENFKKAKPVYLQILNIGKHPFKSWVGYYQDYFAWRLVSAEKLSVVELKERIDKLYFDMLSTMILHVDLSEEERELIPKIHRKLREGKEITSEERNLHCRWFEEGLREKMGLSEHKTINEKDLHFWSNYCHKHGLLNFE